MAVRRLESPGRNETSIEPLGSLKNPKTLRQTSPMALVRRHSPNILESLGSPSRRPLFSRSTVIDVNQPISDESSPTSRSWSHTSPARNVRLPSIQGESPKNATGDPFDKGKPLKSSDGGSIADSKTFTQSLRKGGTQSLYEQLQKKVIAKVGMAAGGIDKTIAESNEDAFFLRLKENLIRMTSPVARRKPSVRRRSSYEDHPTQPSSADQARSLAMMNDHIQGVKAEVAPRRVSVRRRSSTSHTMRASVSQGADASPSQVIAREAPRSAGVYCVLLL